MENKNRMIREYSVGSGDKKVAQSQSLSFGGPPIQNFLNIYYVLSAMLGGGYSLPLWGLWYGGETKTYITKAVNKNI